MYDGLAQKNLPSGSSLPAYNLASTGVYWDSQSSINNEHQNNMYFSSQNSYFLKYIFIFAQLNFNLFTCNF